MPSNLTAIAVLTFSLTVPAGSTAPTVGSVGFVANPYHGDTYSVGEPITMFVSFDTAVSVSGMPQVALTIGPRTRYATFYHAEGRHTYFRYRVRPGDRDTNGITIPQNAIRLNGGIIKDFVATNTDVVLTHTAEDTSTSQKVDGSLAPAVHRIRFHASLLPAGGTYTKGDTMWPEVWFDQALAVSGIPQLALGICSRTRQAN